LIKQFASIIGL